MSRSGRASRDHEAQAFDHGGQGPPVLCCPGFGCSNWIFADLARRLAGQATWIMPDPRGMGRSAPADRAYAIADLARDGLDLMDRLGYERFGLLGISMGGFVAESLVMAAPERVTALVLMCTTGPGPGFVPLPEVQEEMLRTWYAMDPATVVGANTDATVHPSLKQRDPERYHAIMAAKLRNRADLNQVLLQQKAVKAFLEKPLPLASIACPTLVLAGENDRFVAAENARILARTIPNAQLRLFPNTDHLFFLEEPELVAQAVGTFLEAPWT